MLNQIAPIKYVHGTTEWLSLAEFSCSSTDTQSTVPRINSKQLPKISEEETPQPLGNLHWCSVTHSEKISLIFRERL